MNFSRFNIHQLLSPLLSTGVVLLVSQPCWGYETDRATNSELPQFKSCIEISLLSSKLLNMYDQLTDYWSALPYKLRQTKPCTNQFGPPAHWPHTQDPCLFTSRKSPTLLWRLSRFWRSYCVTRTLASNGPAAIKPVSFSTKMTWREITV